MMNILRLRGFCLDLPQMLDFGAHPILLYEGYHVSKPVQIFLIELYMFYKRIQDGF